MDVQKLKQELLRHVAQSVPKEMLHEWQQTANILGIPKEEIEYIVEEMGVSYFDQNQMGFFAKTKAIIEGKHDIEPQKQGIKITAIHNEIIGDGIVLNQDSDLRESPISSKVITHPNKNESAIKTKSWYDTTIAKFIFAVLAAVLAGLILFYLPTKKG